MISLIISLIIGGLIIGALARLVIPGRQNIGILLTILLGIVGSIVGGLIAAAIGLDNNFLSFLVGVAVAALLVFLIAGGSRSRTTRV